MASKYIKQKLQRTLTKLTNCYHKKTVTEKTKISKATNDLDNTQMDLIGIQNTAFFKNKNKNKSISKSQQNIMKMTIHQKTSFKELNH